jgi:murein DD-endopeptidase MepM/ murein hydrolase activator NlpD
MILFRKGCVITALILLNSWWANAQPAPAHAYPQDYFQWPVGAKVGIAANFGELRPNHWHMGLDIRTDQKQNVAVYAAAGGYVAKVKIEPQGFGRAIYINHPNGLTTLYAHLNDFNPALEQYVKEQQYKLESWQVELDIPQELFPVYKGEFIAYSGNTGGSQGPHVHFEIRETATDKVLNPLLFGFPIPDKVPPSLIRLAMYDRRKSVFEQSPELLPLKNTDSGYIIGRKNRLVTGKNKISFAINAYDRLSASNNPNGIYAATLYLDEEPQVQFVLDKISYDETRYMNAHIDYKHDFSGGVYLQHLSKLPGDNGPVYTPLKGDGVIELSDTLPHTVRIEVIDAQHNLAELNFTLQYFDSLSVPLNYSSSPAFYPNEVNVYENEATGFSTWLSENVLYDSLHVNYYASSKPPAGALSYQHQFNSPAIPVHQYFPVGIKPVYSIPAEQQDKVVMVRSYGTRRTVRKATEDGGYYKARFRDFGYFQLYVDDKPPYIDELGRGDTLDLSSRSQITMGPVDNFGEIKRFRAELDGKWLRFTNDKSRLFIYKFDEKCEYGLHELKVTVEDEAGNTSTKTWWFKRYPYTPPPPKKKAVKKTTVNSKKKAGANTKKAPVKKKK